MTYQPGRYDENLHQSRALRAPVSLVCELRQGQRPWCSARLHNLSESGFCIDWVRAIEPGKPLWIRIPGLQLLPSYIRWNQGAVMGCEFQSRLYGPVFEHIVREAIRQQ